jgi:hypothetical protein
MLLGINHLNGWSYRQAAFPPGFLTASNGRDGTE